MLTVFCHHSQSFWLLMIAHWQHLSSVPDNIEPGQCGNCWCWCCCRCCQRVVHVKLHYSLALDILTALMAQVFGHHNVYLCLRMANHQNM